MSFLEQRMAVKNLPLPGKSKGWLGTGVYLKPGQSAKISANGLISFGPFGSWQFPPEGELTKFAQGGAPAPGLVANSLVARAGAGAEYIGSSGTITAARDAQVIIALNDDWPDDNDGHWMVTIES
jgi:hypothetical protein